MHVVMAFNGAELIPLQLKFTNLLRCLCAIFFFPAKVNYNKHMTLIECEKNREIYYNEKELLTLVFTNAVY